MAVQSGPTEKRYAANGVTTTFTIPFLLFYADDVQVYLNGERITSGFTISGVGNPTCTAIFATPPTGILHFYLSVPFQRLIDYQENGDFLSVTVNNDFDRIWQALKQLMRVYGRALILGFNDIDGAGNYQAGGNGIVNVRDPVNPQDAATSSWVGRFVADFIDKVSGAVNTTLGIAYDGGTLFDYLRFGVGRTVDNIATLRLISGWRNQRVFALGYYNKGDGGGGAYFADPSDTTSLDNGGSIIVATDGVRWKLKHDGSVSIKQFGAKMDGSLDSSFVQAALNYMGSIGGGEVIVPKGSTNVGPTGVILPAANLTFRGVGRSSRVYGNSLETGALITYPGSVVDGSGNFVSQDVTDLCIDQQGDGFGIRCHQTWTSAAKIGPSILRNTFINSSPTTTKAKSLGVSGLWAGIISSNQFNGMGSGGGPVNGIGGFGIFFAVASNMNTSVMNLVISENIFSTISCPIWVPDRVGDGRVEGLKIFGNNLVAGAVGIRTSQTLASTITANQISDFNIGIISTGDFDISICGNSEITGNLTGLNIIVSTVSISERITITGNNFGTAAGGACLRITNTVGNDLVRNVTITGNTFNGGQAAVTSGIALQGVYRTNGVVIVANVFSGLVDGVNANNAAHIGLRMDANTYYAVTNRVLDNFGTIIQARRVYAVTYTTALAGGAATEIVNVNVPTGFFSDKPVFATLSGALDMITGHYNYDASTATTLVFTVRGAAGAALTTTTRRFCVVANALDY